MSIKNIIEDLSKKVKIYEVKKTDTDKSKKVDDTVKFSEEQRKLELELLRHKTEKEKSGSKKELETIVANGQITEWKPFEEIEKQHFEKQFEGIKAEYKHHDVINPAKQANEHNNEAYNSGHSNKEEHMHSHYQSSNQKNVYRKNENGY